MTSDLIFISDLTSDLFVYKLYILTFVSLSHYECTKIAKAKTCNITFQANASSVQVYTCFEMCSLFAKTVSIFLIVIVFHASYCLKNRNYSCPQLYKRWYEGYIPKGNDTAGTYTVFENITDTFTCITKCCYNTTCNAALMFNEKCYNIDCKSNEMCIPKLHHDPKYRDNVTMVLVRPEQKNESWVKILKSQDENNENWKENCPKLYEFTYRGYLPRGNESTGNFSYVEGITGFKECILKCCENVKCNVAIMHHHKCYNVHCKTSNLCIPILHHNATTRKSLKMVLVKPVERREQWKEILEKFKESPEENSEELLPEISSTEETTTNVVTWQKPVRELSGIKLELPDRDRKVKRENKKIKVEWLQREGPTKLEFLKKNETSFDVEKSVVGNYLIQLSITEEENSVNITKTETNTENDNQAD